MNRVLRLSPVSRSTKVEDGVRLGSIGMVAKTFCQKQLISLYIYLEWGDQTMLYTTYRQEASSPTVVLEQKSFAKVCT